MRREKKISTLLLQYKICGKFLNEVLMILRQLRCTQKHVDLKLNHHTYPYHQKITIQLNIEYIEIEQKSTI